MCLTLLLLRQHWTSGKRDRYSFGKRQIQFWKAKRGKKDHKINQMWLIQYLLAMILLFLFFWRGGVKTKNHYLTGFLCV